jgi:hypothetical protein
MRQQVVKPRPILAKFRAQTASRISGTRLGWLDEAGFLRAGILSDEPKHLVRDQGVGGSNPLSPTNLSLVSSAIYAALAAVDFAALFGTLGTTEHNSKPIPHCSAHFLRSATSSLTLSYRSSIESPACPIQ